MLKIGKLTDYAMLILSEMAKRKEAILSASELAMRLHLSTATVSKILKMLTEASLVSSVRGADGGYHLAKSPANITLFDVISVMEGGPAMTECCDKNAHCAIDSSCTLRGNWRKINKKIQSFLTTLTINDMLAPLYLEELAHEK